MSTLRPLLLAASLILIPFAYAGQSAPGAPQSPTTAESAGEKALYEELVEVLHGAREPDQKEHIRKLLTEIRARNANSAYLYAALAQIQYLDYRFDGPSTAEEVLALAQRAIEIDPNFADPYVTIAEVQAHEGKAWPAKQAADRAIALAPNKPEAMFAKATAALAQEDYAGAEQWYLKNIEALTNPSRKSNIYYWLARMYLDKRPRDVEKGIAAAVKSVELAPDDPGKLSNAAQMLNESTTRYDQVIDYARRALQLQSNFGHARLQLAMALYARWADGYLHPDRLKAMKQKPLGPAQITEQTRITSDRIFASAGRYPMTGQVPAALLKAKLVSNIDVVPECCTALIAAAEGNNVALAKLLVEKGANVNAVNRNKVTALAWFIWNENLEGIDLLLAHGARVNVVDARGLPLVHLAAEIEWRRSTGMVKHLLAAGADPTLPNLRGMNLLVAAAELQNTELLSLLLEKYHMDPNVLDAQKQSALAWAITGSGDNVAKNASILLAAGANPWTVWGAADVIEVLEGSSRSNPRVFGEAGKCVELLREARKHYPKPAGFEEWIPPAKAGAR